MKESVIRKAKRLARKRGKSVSRIISEYITEEPDEQLVEELPPLTASMVGAGALLEGFCKAASKG